MVAIHCIKAILTHLPHLDQKALCGSISLKKTVLTRQVNYFLHMISDFTFFMVNNKYHNHNDSPVQEGTAGNNS